MKAIKWLKVLAFTLPIALFSCGDDDEKGGGGGGENPPPIGGQHYSEAEQKKMIESSCVEMLDYVKASNFTKSLDLVDYMTESFEDYDFDNIQNWADTCLMSITQFIDKGSYEEEYGYGEEYGKYIYNYTAYKAIFKASAFTGHFTAKDGVWEYKKANDLQFIFKNSKNQTCILKLATSGENSIVYVGEDSSFDYGDSYYDAVTKKWIHTYYTSEMLNYIVVPKTTTISLTENGTEMMSVKLEADFTLSGNTGEIDLTRDRFQVKASFKVEGQTLDITNAFYSTTLISFDAAMKVGTKSIMSIKMGISGNVATQDIGALNVEADIVGQVQLKGNCTNTKALLGQIMASNGNNTDETLFKKSIAEANKLLNIGLYYGTATKHAEIKLLSFKENNYYGDDYWYSEPGIYFVKDKTTYTLGEYLENNEFTKIITQLNKMITEFEILFDKYIEKDEVVGPSVDPNPPVDKNN